MSDHQKENEGIPGPERPVALSAVSPSKTREDAASIADAPAHTPGPWVIAEGHCYPDDEYPSMGPSIRGGGIDDDFICRLEEAGFGDDTVKPTTMGNARLIAAAPDLRDALVEIERRLREDSEPIRKLIAEHGDADARRAWKRTIYSSAIHAQMALRPVMSQDA